jgi:mono/diheme cytochrome c family protein
MAGALAAVLLAGSFALAQPVPVDPALYEEGAAQFGYLCAHCHQPDGTGRSPIFPALAGNERLADLGLIVGNIHNGRGMMPAFASLTAGEIAALATYVRNSWGNNLGGAMVAEVDALLAAMPEKPSGVTVPGTVVAPGD